MKHLSLDKVDPFQNAYIVHHKVKNNEATLP